MAQSECFTCGGSGWDSAMRRSGLPSDTPRLLQPIGVFRCETCGGTGRVGFTDEELEAMRKGIADAIEAGDIVMPSKPFGV